MAYIISERWFEKALSDTDLEDMMARTAPCLEAYGARWIRSYLSNSRQRMICAFEAPDAESVRTAFRVSGMAFERAGRETSWDLDTIRHAMSTAL